MAAGLVGVAVVTSGCVPGTPSDDGRTLTVLAAASLTEVLDQVADDFRATEPDVEVRVSYAGSADLVAQVADGAPADVLVTADAPTMDEARATGRVAGEPVVVATNRLVLVTPPDDPADVAGPEDLARDDVDLVVCAPQVPCGRATVALADELGLEIAPVSEENAVTDVLGKVVAGEADAGVVYVTDARRVGDDVRSVELPDVPTARATYLAAVLDDGAASRDDDGASDHDDAASDDDAAAPDGDAAAAARLVAYLAGPEGQAVLADAGFAAP
ncbi:molybdate ABC transporter substrate-binding protein [Cellulomonas sp. APG4]|uniref:molybdate ABC transporter substrate-binding protein n=1 Tax=Cellulomonas sp. APG4 TaxID=1538656 RepID=UPI00351BC6AA